MDILDNMLVRKYFWVESNEIVGPFRGVEVMAFRVLKSMQEPIRKGDLVLERFPSNPDAEWQLVRCPIDLAGDMHSGWLRLPDRFQMVEKKECDCECHIHEKLGYPCRCSKPPPAAEKCGHQHQHGPGGCECRDSSKCCCDCHKPSASDQAVEAKIKEIKDAYKASALAAFDTGVSGLYTGYRFEEMLRDLVRLAKK